MTVVAISQSNYIPWKGYFDLIDRADEFVLYDDMQYTRRDWRNRNRIKTLSGLQWLTIPVEVKGRYQQAIKDTVISDPSWPEKHWKSLVHNYSRAPHFAGYRDRVESLYADCRRFTHLSEINHHFITAICAMLGITTRITWSMNYDLRDGKSERLLGLCKDLNASTYLSAPAAQGYLDVALFTEERIDVEWMEYAGYPAYRQSGLPFEHGVTTLDLLFNEGSDAPRYLSGKRYRDFSPAQSDTAALRRGGNTRPGS